MGHALAAARGARARNAQTGRRRCSTLVVEAAVVVGALLSRQPGAREELLGPQVALLPVSKHCPSAAQARVALVPLFVAAQTEHLQSAGLARYGHRSRVGSSSVARAVAQLAAAKAAGVKADAVLQVKRKALGKAVAPNAVSVLGICRYWLRARPTRTLGAAAAAGVIVVVFLLILTTGKRLVVGR